MTLSVSFEKMLYFRKRFSFIVPAVQFDNFVCLVYQESNNYQRYPIIVRRFSVAVM
jgi:hypothetical protein